MNRTLEHLSCWRVELVMNHPRIRIRTRALLRPSVGLLPNARCTRTLIITVRSSRVGMIDLSRHERRHGAVITSGNFSELRDSELGACP